MARREKKPVHKIAMTEGKRNIIHQLLQEYAIGGGMRYDYTYDNMGGYMRKKQVEEPCCVTNMTLTAT